MELVWFQGQKWIQESLKLNFLLFWKCTSFNGYNMPHPEIEAMSEHEQFTFRNATCLSFDRNLIVGFQTE
jgi:hypothetical protein